MVAAAGIGSAALQPGRQGRAPQLPTDRNGVPDWQVDPNFKNDVFTFVRIEYDSYRGRRWGWTTDWPDAELNLSFRLQQLTSLRVNPNPISMRLTDPRL